MLSWIFAARNRDVLAANIHERAIGAERGVTELRAAVDRLERRVQELTVQQAVMMKLLEVRADLNAADVQIAVQDALNAATASETPLSSAIEGAVRTCRICGRTRSIHARHCIYCGVQPGDLQ